MLFCLLQRRISGGHMGWILRYRGCPEVEKWHFIHHVLIHQRGLSYSGGALRTKVMKTDVIYIHVVMKAIILFNFIMMILLEFLSRKIRLKRRNRKVCISTGICVIHYCLNVYMHFCPEGPSPVSMSGLPISTYYSV